jgi:hypothetical protein
MKARKLGQHLPTGGSSSYFILQGACEEGERIWRIYQMQNDIIKEGDFLMDTLGQKATRS